MAPPPFLALFFDSVGAGEWVVLFVVVLIVVGPKRLPEVARKLGRLTEMFRRAADEFRRQLLSMDEEPMPPPDEPPPDEPPTDEPQTDVDGVPYSDGDDGDGPYSSLSGEDGPDGEDGPSIPPEPAGEDADADDDAASEDRAVAESALAEASLLRQDAGGDGDGDGTGPGNGPGDASSGIAGAPPPAAAGKEGKGGKPA